MERSRSYYGDLLMQYRFTTRFGGVSQAPFDSLNLALHVGDDPLHVKKNRELLQEDMGVSKLVFMDQIHGDKVVLIEHGDEEMPTCDAMITEHPDIALCVMVADCIPILYYDAVHQAIGVAHAGRAGSQLNIGQKCALAMQEAFGTHMHELRIFMGPSIHACCYEVGEEVITGFEKFVHIQDKKYFLDLQHYNRDAFLELGIKPEHLEISKECSCSNHNYFSYRRDKITGRFAGVIAL